VVKEQNLGHSALIAARSSERRIKLAERVERRLRAASSHWERRW
jgi:hypothetical protein